MRESIDTIERVDVSTKEQLDKLYNRSALTIEGLFADEENLSQLFDWIENYTSVKKRRVYVIQGETMNSIYGLTGDNAYPKENCSIVCIELLDLENPIAVAIPRFEIGGRWFDDVVDNNLDREDMR